jgi:transcription initiation factor TFIIB
MKEDIIKCSECNSRELSVDSNSGETYCEECGLVLEENIFEETSAGREKDSDPQSDRTHNPNRVGFTLGSMVGTTNVDGTKDRSQTGRTLRRLNQRVSLKSHEKNRSKGFALVTMLVSEFVSSPAFREQAVWNYKRIHDNQVLKGMSLETRAAAVVYYTFKENGISRTIEEICRKNMSHPRQVAKCARRIATFFRKPWILSQKNIDQDVEKYCSQLGVNRLFTTSAIKLTSLMHNIAEQRYMNVNAGFTAACIYLTGILLTPTVAPRTQMEISNALNITEVTLRTNLRKALKMVDRTKEDLPHMSYDEFMEGVYRICPKEEEE